MRKPVKKVEKRNKQSIIINITIVALIVLIGFIMLFDSMKSDDNKKNNPTVSEDMNLNNRPTQIPRKPAPKPKVRRKAKNQDYKKYQSYFEEVEDIDEGSFDPDSEAAKE